MEYKIINTKDYLLIVDDSEIKSYYYDFFINKLKHSRGAEYAKSDIAKQVIAHLPLNNSPILEGVDLLPSLEDEPKSFDEYKYTKEDMIDFAIWRSTTVFKEPYTPLGQFRLWESLQQPKMPVGFKCEMVNCDKCIYVQGGNLSPDCCNQLKPKTTTNSQGTQWVGEYIYD